jgi:hypothetical protein
MRRPVPKLLAAVAALLALAACQKPDVGQECPLAWGPAPKPDASCPPAQEGFTCFTVAADYFETGNVTCENLVCVLSPVGAGSKYDRAAGVGYCSKPCVSNDDCFESETSLVCRQMVLDGAFIEELKRTDPALLERYLGEVQLSSYCAVP